MTRVNRGREAARAVTMKDVAKRAGVSATTVSHVINKTRFVSKDVKARVLRAMEELSYQPNAIARSLKTRATQTIGLIISDIANPFFTGLVRGVEDVANSKGYNLILCNTDEKPEKERMYIHVLMQKQVDGIIMTPTGGNREYIAGLVKKGFPLVFVDRYLEDVEAPAVLVDNEEGACQAVEHLIMLGHTRIAIITGLRRTTIVDRLKGYERALEKHGLVIDLGLIKAGSSSVDGGFEATLELLALDPRPTAIFPTNNLMTIGAMRALQSRGIRCPEDIAVVGFDDFEWASAFRPFFTTVSQPVYDEGKTAAEVLIAQMKGRKVAAGRTVLKSTLNVRESCGFVSRL